MRNKAIYVLCLLFPLLGACDDYLKDDSDDLLIPESVNDYAPILMGEAYPDDLSDDLEQVHLMTDDVEMGPLYYDETMANRVVSGVDGYYDGEKAYTWGEITENIWEHYYNYILGCNVIIEALPTMTYTEKEGLYVAGILLFQSGESVCGAMVGGEFGQAGRGEACFAGNQCGRGASCDGRRDIRVD